MYQCHLIQPNIPLPTDHTPAGNYSAALAELGWCPALTVLDISANPGLQGTWPAQWGYLTSLQELHAAHTGLSGVWGAPLQTWKSRNNCNIVSCACVQQELLPPRPCLDASPITACTTHICVGVHPSQASYQTRGAPGAWLES